MSVSCDYCGRAAELVTGDALYPGRDDLRHLQFWRCGPCRAHVGCHRKGAIVRIQGGSVTSDGTMPLGRLANAELRLAKGRAHAAFDPLWKDGEMSRHRAYRWLAKQIGIAPDDCHIGMFDLEQCRAVVRAVRERSHA